MASRVVSKHLFNFIHHGVLDEDVLEDELRLAAREPDEATLKILQMLHNEDDAVFIKGLQILVETGVSKKNAHPAYQKSIAECSHSELKVPTSHDGKYDVTVLVHKPKCLEEDASTAAIIYAHGGGVVSCTAEMFKPYLSSIASECGVVVFNVDYRLAPKAKCPNNVLDFYEVIKYVVNNAENLSVDPNKIAIAGESGGGYICFGSMVLMAQRNESQLIKLAMPNIPMISDYCFSDIAEMTAEEREYAPMLRRVWKSFIAFDFEKQRTDPLLFPSKANDELLRKMPPTIVWSAEFDMFLTETVRFANRLRVCGRLLELAILPGIKHATNYDPKYKSFRVGMDAYKLAVQEYLL